MKRNEEMPGRTHALLAAGLLAVGTLTAVAIVLPVSGSEAQAFGHRDAGGAAKIARFAKDTMTSVYDRSVVRAFVNPGFLGPMNLLGPLCGSIKKVGKIQCNFGPRRPNAERFDQYLVPGKPGSWGGPPSKPRSVAGPMKSTSATSGGMRLRSASG